MVLFTLGGLAIFRFLGSIPVPGVDPKILNPRNTWKNKDAYDATLKKLGNKFLKNFQKY